MYKLAVLGAVALLTACATGGKVRDLNVGQDRASVEKQLGRPDGYAQVDGYDVLTYKNRLMSGWSWDRADYQVVLKDGKVVQYGPGEVRQAQNHAGVLIVAPVR
jgi:hypothetical protein